MALWAKTNPVKKITSIFSTKTCPVYGVASKTSLFTQLTSVRLAKSFVKPFVDSSIGGFISRPSRVCCFVNFPLFEMTFLTKLSSISLGIFPTFLTDWGSASPIMIFISSLVYGPTFFASFRSAINEKIAAVNTFAFRNHIMPIILYN